MTEADGGAAADADDDSAAALAAAEAWLLERELFGIRPGLDRMRRLLARLGDPQTRFDAIHVVGSNGKTSTVTIAAALLERHGVRTGAYLSPHLVSFRERVQLAGRPSAPGPFAAAVGRVRAAAEALEAGPDAEPVGVVTQFEAVTAAAFLVLADAGVACAVIEAGLGGRWDATNVLPEDRRGGADPGVAVLTSVSLEHTRWLGDTVAQIAAEKVEVLRPGGTLVVADGLPAAALRVARARVAAGGGTLVRAAADPGAGVATPGAPGYQRRNLATAIAAVRAYRGPGGNAGADAAAERDVAARLRVPGRFETVEPAVPGPTVIHDGAHNPAGIAALAEALDGAAPARPVVLVVGVLDDKDPVEMLRGLAGRIDEVVAVRPRNPRALPAAALAATVSAALPGVPVTVVEDPHGGVDQARTRAGAHGTVLVTGSLHLVADLRRDRRAAPGSAF